MACSPMLQQRFFYFKFNLLSEKVKEHIHPAQAEGSKELHHIYSDLVTLQQFRDINLTGFKKIVKKVTECIIFA